MAYRGTKHYENDYLLNIVNNSFSKHEVLKKLGLPTGGTYGYRTLNYFLDLYKIDTSHFAGRGATYMKIAIPLQEILDGDHPLYGAHKLKKRLIKDGLLEAKCDECNITEWRGKPAPLDLDHINGKSWDHDFKNLRLLCRNCHAQTDTFCGKNSKNRLNNCERSLKP